MMTTRQPGYYWCKYKGEWIVAEYWQISNCCGWSMMEEENILFTDSDFEEIDERRIERKVDKPCEPEPPTAEEIKMDAEYRALFGRYLDIDKNPEWT